MSVTLTPRLEAIVRRKVEDGFYGDPESVLTEALRLLDEQDARLTQLRAAIAVGDQSASIPWTQDLMDQIAREADEMVRQGIQPDADVCP